MYWQKFSDPCELAHAHEWTSGNFIHKKLASWLGSSQGEGTNTKTSENKRSNTAIRNLPKYISIQESTTSNDWNINGTVLFYPIDLVKWICLSDPIYRHPWLTNCIYFNMLVTSVTSYDEAFQLVHRDAERYFILTSTLAVALLQLKHRLKCLTYKRWSGIITEKKILNIQTKLNWAFIIYDYKQQDSQ